MADVVQFRLERMVDELDDLEKRGLFTKDEIKHIAKKRRDFEYKLKRHSPLKRDFLAYIDYEDQVDYLRRLRRKAILRVGPDDGNKKQKRWKKSISDFASTTRILDIYRKATAKFKGDVDLWFRYLEFCRRRRNGRIKQAMAEALHFHPNVPGLWIYAAMWEFDSNLNAAAARALMQSGLRACPQSEDLWIEYVRMELTYLHKLQARKVAAGKGHGDKQKNGDDEKKWEDENGDMFMSLDDEKLTRNDPDSGSDGVDSEDEVDLLQKHGSEIFRTIYTEAIEAIPSSMSLHKRFLEFLDATDVYMRDEIRGEIMQKMHKSFSGDENYWDWLARMQISKDGKNEDCNGVLLSQLRKAAEVYEEALTVIPSPKMHSLHARFWSDIMDPEETEPQSLCLNSLSSDVMEFISNLLRIYEKACSSHCVTEDLAKHYISLHLKLGKLEEARKLAGKLSGELPHAISLYALWITIVLKCSSAKSDSVSRDELQYFYEFFVRILTGLPFSDAETLWLLAFKFFSNVKDYFDKMVDTFLLELAGGGGVEVGVISSAILDSVLQTSGLRQVREMYKRILALPHPSLATYRHCIELESNLACVGDEEALPNARNLYESALNFYREDVELWRDYYCLELKVGTSRKSSAIFWRARKILQDRADILVQERHGGHSC